MCFHPVAEAETTAEKGDVYVVVDDGGMSKAVEITITVVGSLVVTIIGGLVLFWCQKKYGGS